MSFITPTTVRRIVSNKKELPPFHNLLNLWAIEEEVLIGLDLQFTSLFEIITPDLDHKIESEQRAFFQMAKNFLHALPENMTLQFLVQGRIGDNAAIDAYQNLILPTSDRPREWDEIARYIVDAKVQHLKSSFQQKRRFYLFVTTWPKNTDLSKLQVSPFKIMNVNYKSVTEAMHRERMQEHKSALNDVRSAIQSAGVAATPLDEAAVTKLLYEYLNPSRSAFLSPKNVNPEETLRSQIVFNAPKAEFDHVHMDGCYFRTVNLQTRPDAVSFVMLTKLIDSLPPDYDFSIALHTVNQENAVKKLQSAATWAGAIAGAHVHKKYEEAEHKSDAAKSMVSEVKATFQKIFNVSMAVVLRDTTLTALTRKTNDTVQAFRILGECEAVIDDMNHMPLYLSVLPNHSHLNFRQFPIHSEAAAQLLPLNGPWSGCKTPKMIFQTDDDQLVHLDLFDPGLSAKHALIMGASGSGKSFTLNFVLTYFFIESEDNHIIIIEPGHSYKKFCRIFGGQYLEIDLSGEYALNPFPKKSDAVINADPKQFEIDPDTISFLTNVIQKMLKLQTLSGQDQTILEKAIINAYRYAKTDPPLLSSVVYQLKELDSDEKDREIALGFAKNLEIWTTGRFGKLINRENSIKIDSRIVVFDLKKLDDQPDLQAVVFFLIKSVIYGKLKNLKLRKMIVVDECWKMLDDEVGEKMIKDLYKTARKYNGAIYSVSQNTTDFLKCRPADSIIDNSYVKYVLNMLGGHQDLLKFRFNEAEVEEVKNLTSLKGKYSEIFVKFDRNCRVIKIAPSPTDYWICTTDTDVDSKLEDKMRASHPEYTEFQIIKALSEEKKP